MFQLNLTSSKLNSIHLVAVLQTDVHDVVEDHEVAEVVKEVEDDQDDNDYVNLDPIDNGLHSNAHGRPFTINGNTSNTNNLKIHECKQTLPSSSHGKQVVIMDQR